MLTDGWPGHCDNLRRILQITPKNKAYRVIQLEGSIVSVGKPVHTGKNKKDNPKNMYNEHYRIFYHHFV
jgi:hypothetical protein